MHLNPPHQAFRAGHCSFHGGSLVTKLALFCGVTALAIGGLVSWAYVWYRPHGRLALQEVAVQISELILAMVHASDAPVNQTRRRRPR